MPKLSHTYHCTVISSLKFWEWNYYWLDLTWNHDFFGGLTKKKLQRSILKSHGQIFYFTLNNLKVVQKVVHTQRPLCTIVNNEADQYTVLLDQYTVLREQYTLQYSIPIHGAVYCSTRLHLRRPGMGTGPNFAKCPFPVQGDHPKKHPSVLTGRGALEEKVA